MKKHIISSLLVLAFLISLVGIILSPRETEAKDEDAYNKEIEEDFLEYVSNTDQNLEKYYQTDIDQIIIDSDDTELLEIGEDTVISRAEVEQYETFYELNHIKDSKKEALKYAQQRHALYVEAINHGFNVTDKEINDYLNELKKTFSNIFSKEELEDLYSKYGSENEYWSMEREVYSIDLPIQKYAASLEETFFKENEGKIDAEELNTAWSLEYERIKEQIVDEQNYSDQ